MLSQRYPADALNVISQAAWKPYPGAADRAAWDALPAPLRASLIAAGEAALQIEWKPLLASRFLEYARVGNRTRYEAENFERRNKLIALALAECVENRGRFADEIADGIWLICEETYWGLPAHVGMQQAGSGLPDAAEPTVDLFAAETAAALAYIAYLLGDALDAVSPLLRPRVAAEIDHRILTPNLERDDFKWMGFQTDERPNNWNPWINSNWLACVLFCEPDPERRRQSVAKILHSLDRFIDPYPADGGCDEGPGYWSRAAGSLYDCLDLLYQATGGQIDVSDQPLVQEMGRFIVRAHIDGDFALNFADASAVTQPEASLVYAYGQYIGDRDMIAYGAWLARREDSVSVWGSPIHSPMRRLRTIFCSADMAQADAYAPQPRDVWLPVIEVMAARDQSRSGQGFYVAAKGGHNDESHNHNDVGEFVVYLDGCPLLVDAGVESYSRKTFSPQRYEIWTMQSAYHNLPTIDGIQQQPGESFAARDVVYVADDTQASLSLDLAGAYPPAAGIERWQRTVRLLRGQEVIVEDDYALNRTPQTLTLSLLTPGLTAIDRPGEIAFSPRDLPAGHVSAAGVVLYHAEIFEPSIEQIDIADARMGGVWGDRLYRIVLTARHPQPQGMWRLRVKPA